MGKMIPRIDRRSNYCLNYDFWFLVSTALTSTTSTALSGRALSDRSDRSDHTSHELIDRELNGGVVSVQFIVLS